MSKVVFDSEKITSRTLFISRTETDYVRGNIMEVAFRKIRREIDHHIPPTFQQFILMLLDYEFTKGWQEIRPIDHEEDVPFFGRITCSWHYLPEPIYRHIMDFISRHRLEIRYLDGLKLITTQRWRLWVDEMSPK